MASKERNRNLFKSNIKLDVININKWCLFHYEGLWVIYFRTKEVLGQELNLDFLFYDLPKIDIKQIIVLFNNGQFKGASLDIFSNKTHSGALHTN